MSTKLGNEGQVLDTEMNTQKVITATLGMEKELLATNVFILWPRDF
jgi:hypothetical protein